MDEEILRFELNRYLGWPGQAPSYKVGERIWLQPRDEAQAARGRRVRPQGLPPARARPRARSASTPLQRRRWRGPCEAPPAHAGPRASRVAGAAVDPALGRRRAGRRRVAGSTSHQASATACRPPSWRCSWPELKAEAVARPRRGARGGAGARLRLGARARRRGARQAGRRRRGRGAVAARCAGAPGCCTPVTGSSTSATAGGATVGATASTTVHFADARRRRDRRPTSPPASRCTVAGAFTIDGLGRRRSSRGIEGDHHNVVGLSPAAAARAAAPTSASSGSTSSAACGAGPTAADDDSRRLQRLRTTQG